MIDDGALCVFVDGFAAPMIVRKRDGGFGLQQRIWQRSGAGYATCMPTGSSTSWTRGSLITSTWCSPWHARRASCLTT